MGVIKDEIKALFKEHGSRAGAIKEAQNWFEKGVSKLKDNTIVSTRTPFKPGMIYVFKYMKPKYIEELEWWDRHPVVLALDRTDQKNDLGINLNLLPEKIKIELLDAIYKQKEGFIKKQRDGKTAENAKLQGPIKGFTYESAKKFLEKFGYDFAIRQYIPKLKTNQQVVAYEKWSYVAICNLLESKSNEPSIRINEKVIKTMFDEHYKTRAKRRSKK
jgi:hypothetical protein